MGQVAFIIGAILLTVPGIVMRLLGVHIDPLVDSGVYGMAVIGAAFLLSWAAEVAQHDIPRSLALTILALIAVLPEYAVDMYLAWRAADDPATYGPLALVNMTGANRLLIGLGWPVVVFLYWYRSRQLGRRTTGITLDEGQNTEILFLGLATLYSFLIPIKGTLDLIDVVVLAAIFGAYAWRVAQSEHVEPDLIGPARLVGQLADGPRRLITLLFFAIAGFAIFMVAEPFAESLISAGVELGFDRRTLVQWLAPLASEAPEFLITGIFAWRLLGSASLGALVSSKVNQWTLLVGALPVAFMVASGAMIGLPLDSRQSEELFLTSAQSLLATMLIIDLDFSRTEAVFLTGAFAVQLFFPDAEVRLAFGVLYIVMFVGLMVHSRSRRQAFFALLGFRR